MALATQVVSETLDIATCFGCPACRYNGCILNYNVDSSYPCYFTDVIKLQLVEAGLVECLLEIVQKTVDSDKEDDVAELKTASDLMVLLLLGGKCSVSLLQSNSRHLCAIWLLNVTTH